MSADDGRRPIRRALVSVYDKTGLVELARALHAAGVEIVSTGSTAAHRRGGRRAGDPGRGADRLPGVPRRPGQDAAPAGARRPARRPAAATRTARSSPSWASRRSTCWCRNLYPFTETVASGATRRRVRRADRHRRAGDGPGGRQEPRHRRGGDLAVAAYPLIVAGARRRRFHAGRSARALAARAFADIAEYDVAVAQLVRRPGRCRAGRVAGVRRARRCSAAGRAALRREPAPAGRALRRPGRAGRAGAGRAAARQGDVVQQLRRRRRRLAQPPTTSPSRAWRSSSTPTRAASRSAPTWPRRTARRTPATRCPRSAG